MPICRILYSQPVLIAGCFPSVKGIAPGQPSFRVHGMKAAGGIHARAA